MKRLEGRTVLITGASSGLGRACAMKLADEGAKLVLVGRQQGILAEVSAATGGAVQVCDVNDEAQLRAMLASAKAETGGAVHGWVLAAGVQKIRPLIMESRATLDSSWSTNVQGALILLALAAKARMIAPGGSIVLFSSAATHAGGAGLVSYAATKGALEAATRSLALELAAQKIRVNAVAPGVVKTPMSDSYMSKLTEEQVRAIEKEHPLGFGSPEDIAGPVTFLLSDESRWFTGQTMFIDGGLTIH